MLPPPLWFFDADTIGPGKTLATVRTDVTWPGDSGQREGPERRWLPACPVTATDTPDRVWIPEVTRHGMRIITRDKKIQSRLVEIEMVRAHKAKMFVLEPEGPGTRWELLEIVVTNWRAMER